MNGIQYLIRFLEGKQTKVVFGYPGSAVLPIYEELQQSKLIHRMVRHEQGAVHAAEGYAKATGRVGVCLATSGPGATNLITGLCDAMLDSVPLLAITGQVETTSIGHDAFQEADVMGMTIPVTKHNFLIKEADSIPTILEEAWRITTTGRPGPVLVDIPKDVMTSELSSLQATPKLPRLRRDSRTFESVKNRILNVCNASFRPILLLGGGVVSAGAGEALLAFAEKHALPVVYTMMGKGAIPGRYPGNFGMVGIHGNPFANLAMYKSDLVIAVGCRFSDRTLPRPQVFSETRAVIHADIDPAELSKNVRSVVTVASDAYIFAKNLLELTFLPEKKEAWQRRFLNLCAQRVKEEVTQEVLTVAHCMDTINANYPGYRIVTDVGQHQLHAANRMDMVLPRGFITSGGLGTMGFGLPASIGASFAEDESPVILFTGDGSFQMCMQELATLPELQRPIKIFLFDNRSLGLVRQWHDVLYSGEASFCALPPWPDFCKIADAYGLDSYSFDSVEGFESGVKDMMNSSRHCLAVLHTDPGEKAPFFRERSCP